MYQRILAPIDGSPTSMRGLDEAIKLARDQRASLRLLYVVDQKMVAIDPSGFVPWESVIESLRQGGEQILRDAEARAAEHAVEAEPRMVETQYGVWRSILDEAASWPADLIVMGTHGRRGMARLILGSDAQGVLHGTTVPVLLVRGQAEE
jgi:nucleotide-binding universal stress UspA family protein